MSQWRKNAFVRKGIGLLRQIPRGLRRLRTSPEEYASAPPVLCNSVPKSGTHLLLQVLGSLPGVRGYGTFLASTPTLTYCEAPPERMARRARRLVPGELAAAHLFFSEPAAEALAERRAVHFLVYRDPRDVAVSEALYLATMNRWHRLHGSFRDLPSDEARISLAIRGAEPPAVPCAYPDIATRYRRFLGWMGRPDVMAVRFEDLVGAGRDATVRAVVDFYADRCGRPLDRARLTDGALTAIDPRRSHTFREGRAGGWRERLTPAHRRDFDRLAGDLLVELGYEPDRAWADA